MFGRLIQKEFLHHLLDFRFVAVFGLSALLSALSVYVGTQNHARELREYTGVTENSRLALQKRLDNNRMGQFAAKGYRWNRRPEVLSPVVYGLAGKLGREVVLQYQRSSFFEGSLFEVDSIHALFGILDLAFIVKFVLSLCVLLFTFDAVCGEKEAGTLRLYASFSVSRVTIALAKLVGSTAAVLVPSVFAFLLASTVLALSPSIDMKTADWGRMAGIFFGFVLYLSVFAAFGLCVSAFTQRRMTAFMVLMGLWTVWLFVLPNLAVRTARGLSPAESVFSLERKSSKLRWEIRQERFPAVQAYWDRFEDVQWDSLSEARRQEILEGSERMQAKWDSEFNSKLPRIHTARRNQIRTQQRLGALLSSLSPLGPVSYMSMDLARTGYLQQERIEDAKNAHMIYLTEYVRKKRHEFWETRSLKDFSPFAFDTDEPLPEVVSRNLIYVLNLVLMAVAGFVGAFVGILRYDVR